jgi:hypothetical protein
LLHPQPVDHDNKRDIGIQRRNDAVFFGKQKVCIERDEQEIQHPPNDGADTVQGGFFSEATKAVGHRPAKFLRRGRRGIGKQNGDIILDRIVRLALGADQFALRRVVLQVRATLWAAEDVKKFFAQHAATVVKENPG